MSETPVSFAFNDLTDAHFGALIDIVSHPKFYYAYINQDKQDPVVGACKYLRRAQRQTLDCVSKGIFNPDHELIGSWSFLHVRPMYTDIPELGSVAEIAYFLRVQNQGKGLGKQIVRTMVDWGREHLDICYLDAVVDPANVASNKIILGLNMKQIGYIPETASAYLDRDGQPRPRNIYHGFVG